MPEYDNTNTAAIFTIEPEKAKLVGAGKWNDNSFDKRIILVKETYPDGNEHRELYAKVGRLYENDSENENAPQFTGPISTDRGQMRIACWVKETARGTVLSMKIEEKKQFPPKDETNVHNLETSIDDKDDDEVPF
tara:strand:- start:653 stop:1057 length:405 start_codon:yes stop_codon:yes gene_type:complete